MNWNGIRIHQLFLLLELIGSYNKDKAQYQENNIFPISGIDQRYSKKIFEAIHFFLVRSNFLALLTFIEIFAVEK